MLETPLRRSKGNEAAFQSSLKGVIHSWGGKLEASRFWVCEASPSWQFNTGS